MMKTNYDNPYFVNDKMRSHLHSYLQKTSPIVKGNNAIQADAESYFPNTMVTEYEKRRG
jgi:hypothetical protein